ncbi:MAG TPA: LysR family transcriptional regulator [Terricaulis sp.]|nr:LysR family transcriptional regulator [Terricaulis sp.]
MRWLTFHEGGNRALTKTSSGEPPRSRLDWDDVRIFAAVAEAGSVSKAALQLKVTTGMVSRRIEALEARLDVKLFVRTAMGVELTVAGEEVLDYALSMQRFASVIEDTVRGRDRKAEGAVRLSVPDGLASYWLAPRLAAFQRENPNIQVLLDCGLWAADILGARPDLSITADKSAARPEDIAKPLARLHYLFAAAQSYIDLYGAPSSLVDVAENHRKLHHVAQVHQRESWTKRASAIEALSVNALETNSSAVLMATLLGGGGVATIPSYGFHLFPQLALIEGAQSFPIDLWLVVHHESRHAARVQKVLSWLERCFDRKEFPWFREEYVHPDQFEAELSAIEKRRARA